MKYEKSPIDGSTPDEVLNSVEKSNQFKDTIRKTIASRMQIPVEAVIVTNLSWGSISFDIIINNPQLLQKQNQTKLQERIKLMVKKNTLCKIMADSFGVNGIPKEIEIEPFQRPLKFCLCANDIDSRFNFNFPSSNGEIQMRGGMKYFQPNNEWWRLGLHVLDLYENNDWIQMDGNVGEWAVGFHGTSSSGENGTTSIASTRFFAVGAIHAYENVTSNALHTKGQKFGGAIEEAIYFTKDINSCFKLQCKGYEIAFQCRINPRYIYDLLPDDGPSYCVVRGSENIRPYGICFKRTQ